MAKYYIINTFFYGVIAKYRFRLNYIQFIFKLFLIQMLIIHLSCFWRLLVYNSVKCECSYLTCSLKVLKCWTILHTESHSLRTSLPPWIILVFFTFSWHQKAYYWEPYNSRLTNSIHECQWKINLNKLRVILKFIVFKIFFVK